MDKKISKGIRDLGYSSLLAEIDQLVRIIVSNYERHNTLKKVFGNSDHCELHKRRSTWIYANSSMAAFGGNEKVCALEMAVSVRVSVGAWLHIIPGELHRGQDT